MTLPSECQQPLWDRIVSDCKRKILEKYPQYGNSWKDFDLQGTNTEFWKKRLLKEVEEVFEKQGVNRLEELTDVINICAMMYSIEAELWHDWCYGQPVR